MAKKIGMKELNEILKKRKFHSSDKDDKPWNFRFENPKIEIEIGRCVQVDCGEQSFICPAGDLYGYLLKFKDTKMSGRLVEKLAHHWPKNWNAAFWMIELESKKYTTKKELDALKKQIKATDLLEDEFLKTRFEALTKQVQTRIKNKK